MTSEVRGGLNNEDSSEYVMPDVNDLDIDVSRAHHDVPAVDELGDVESFKEFGLRYEDALKQVSVYKYESEESFLREYITNMISTCLETQEELGDDYSPLIHVIYNPEQNLLILEDNGMGMTESELDGPALELGYGENRHNPEQPGYFGIGKVSVFNVIDFDGVFFVETRSRRNDDYTTGLWCIYGLQERNDVPTSFEENQYGTRFEIPLKQDTDLNVKRSLQKIARYSRIPILYTEKTGNPQTGTTTVVSDDEFESRSETPFIDQYGDSNGAVVIENDAFRAVHHPKSNNRGVLLDVPIDLNVTKSTFKTAEENFVYSLPYNNNIDILIKEEGGRIVDGPHEGMIKVPDSEYEAIDDAKKDEYIKQSHCSTDDIAIPVPAGDRDRLEKHKEFWVWLSEQLIIKFRNRVKNIVKQAETKNSVLTLDEDEIDFIDGYLDSTSGNTVRGWKKNTLVRRLNEYDLSDVNESVIDDFALISDRVELAERGNNPWRAYNREDVALYEMIKHMPSDATVWMAQRPSHRKAKIIWEDNPGHKVIRAEEHQIETYEDVFGWRQLNYVSKETLDEFNVSEESRNAFTPDYKYENPNAGKDAAKRELTLHRSYLKNKRSEPKDKTRKLTAEYLKYYFDALNNGYQPSLKGWHTPIKRVLLAPPGAEAKVSDWAHTLTGLGIRIANCAQKTWEYLQSVPQIEHIDAYLENAKTTTFETSAGNVTLEEASNIADEHDIPLIVHLVREHVVDGLRTQPAPGEAAEWFAGQRRGTLRSDPDDLDGAVYVAMGEEEFEDYRYVLRKENMYLAIFEVGATWMRDKTITQCDFDSSVYLYSVLADWRDEPEYKLIKKYVNGLTENVVENVDRLREHHDAGGDPPSQADEVSKDLYDAMMGVASND